MKKTIFLLLAISWQVVAQEAKFSNPMAPVTNTELTVPKEVKPIFDYWLRDTYVARSDGTYYLTGTTATPNRVFPMVTYIAGITTMVFICGNQKT
jgi:hypothetical protein